MMVKLSSYFLYLRSVGNYLSCGSWQWFSLTLTILPGFPLISSESMFSTVAYCFISLFYANRSSYIRSLSESFFLSDLFFSLDLFCSSFFFEEGLSMNPKLDTNLVLSYFPSYFRSSPCFFISSNNNS